MHKERFPSQRCSKLQPRGDGPFQVVARISDNAYRLDLPGEYNVSATFNVADLSPFDFEGADSRTNPLEERGNDDNPSATRNHTPTKIQDPLSYDGGPITRARAKKMKDALHMLIQAIWAQSTNLNNSDPYGAHGINSGPKLIHLVQIEDLGPNNVIGSNLDSLSPKE